MAEVVADTDALLRRVPDNPDLWSRGPHGDLRVSSVAFKPSSDDRSLSVDIRRLLADPKHPEATLDGSPNHGLIEFAASVPRSLDLDVVHAPLEDNWAHGNVVGFPEGKPATKRLTKSLARSQVVWVRHPGGC